MPQAVPLRVPGRTNRGRNSLPGSGSDEISHLSLGEVRDRLARNERVLNTSLFSTSPTAASSFAAGSPTARRVSNPDAPDPVRDRLLAVREQLLAREAELLADSIGGMSLSPSSPSRLASSPPTRSGKARALDAIRQGELHLAPNSMVFETLALQERDFDNQTAARFAQALSLDRPDSGRGKQRHIDDELGRAQQAARYARARVAEDEDDDLFDTDEAYAAAQVYASGHEDAGNGLPLATARARRSEGYDDDMRDNSDDEDNEFAEGNDEYAGGGAGSYGAGPDR
ncbi:hypothetical protein Q8F55_003857 [Vanrija albida]|uniref:Uncharacterized protein n=1 Tax=Vanrija albida TaxID=181172 RepID=A0ABR3Q5B0_9TREE